MIPIVKDEVYLTLADLVSVLDQCQHLLRDLHILVHLLHVHLSSVFDSTLDVLLEEVGLESIHDL